MRLFLCKYTMIKNAIVLGNGQSRLEVNLADLKLLGTVYGCNALYREFSPDVLVSTDPGISGEIQMSGYSKTHTHYTRKPLPDKGAKLIEHHFGWSSGPIALTYAAASDATSIYFVGFDLSGLAGKFNNVYADTAHYKKSADTATYNGNWIRQIAQLLREYPSKQFIRVTGSEPLTPEEWKTANYSETTIRDFNLMINNMKPD